MTIRVTLLGRTLPDSVERIVHVLDPGQTIGCDIDWRNRLVVVEHGVVEIETAFGGRVRLGEGDSFCVSRLARLIRNRGAGHAVLATVRRGPTETGRP